MSLSPKNKKIPNFLCSIPNRAMTDSQRMRTKWLKRIQRNWKFKLNIHALESLKLNIHALESRYSGDLISVQKCMCVAFNRIWHNRANYDRTFDMVIQQLNPIDEKICTLKIVSNAFINALTKCFHRKNPTQVEYQTVCTTNTN